jgi:hypothetical protein
MTRRPATNERQRSRALRSQASHHALRVRAEVDVARSVARHSMSRRVSPTIVAISPARTGNSGMGEPPSESLAQRAPAPLKAAMPSSVAT